MEEASSAKSNTLFYVIAVLCGAAAGVAHVGIEDPLITALMVLASTMFLGYMRPRRPWVWVVIVGGMVPLVMAGAWMMGRYAGFTRAGLYGSVLLALPGVAGAYGGFFGRKFMTEFFFDENRGKK